MVMMKAINTATTTGTSTAIAMEPETELVISVVALCLGANDDTPFRAVTAMIYCTSGCRPGEKLQYYNKIPACSETYTPAKLVHKNN
jgi:hypothetical protein